MDTSNKIQREISDYIYKVKDKSTTLKFNKPMISTNANNKLKFDLKYYKLNSPNNYKKNYYVSDACRNYSKPRIELDDVVNYSFTMKSNKNKSKNREVKTTFDSLYKSTIFTHSPTTSANFIKNGLSGSKRKLNSEISKFSTSPSSNYRKKESKFSNSSYISQTLANFKMNNNSLLDLGNTKEKNKSKLNLNFFNSNYHSKNKKFTDI